jgi:transcriptional regulator with XRE-family HTH domain
MTTPEDFAPHLAENVRRLRESQDLTQTQLARRAGVPRATLSLLESGTGNPTLSVVLRVCQALSVRLDEALELRSLGTRVYRKDELPQRARGGCVVKKLLPENIDGLELERLQIPAGRTLVGVPHTAGTREYLCVDTGALELRIEGELHCLDEGDVAVFRGDQKHSYKNVSRREAKAFSVLAFGGST